MSGQGKRGGHVRIYGFRLGLWGSKTDISALFRALELSAARHNLEKFKPVLIIIEGQQVLGLLRSTNHARSNRLMAMNSLNPRSR